MEEVIKNISGQDLSDAMAQISKLVETYGEEAVDLALLVVQLGSIESIAIFVILFSATFFVINNILKPSFKLWEQEDFIEGCLAVISISFLLVSIILTASTVINGLKLSDPIIWLSAFGYPEVEVARQILDKVM